MNQRLTQQVSLQGINGSIALITMATAHHQATALIDKNRAFAIISGLVFLRVGNYQTPSAAHKGY